MGITGSHSESIDVAAIEPWHIHLRCYISRKHSPEPIVQRHLLATRLEMGTRCVEPFVSDFLIHHIEKLVLFHAPPSGA